MNATALDEVGEAAASRPPDYGQARRTISGTTAAGLVLGFVVGGTAAASRCARCS